MAEHNVNHEGAFIRSPAYRSLRNFTKLNTGKEKKKVIKVSYNIAYIS